MSIPDTDTQYGIILYPLHTVVSIVQGQLRTNISSNIGGMDQLTRHELSWPARCHETDRASACCRGQAWWLSFPGQDFTARIQRWRPSKLIL